MKTKYFLTALAIPAVFAACTADDFITEQSQDPNLGNRPVVGNVSFVLPGADTRLIWDADKVNPDGSKGGLIWTEGDKLGAALMDKPNGNTDTDPQKNYTIVNELYSNYRYDYNGKTFENGKALFVEGNYFVYAQYNEDQKRTGLAYSIPAYQNGGKDGLKSWYENQMWLDHIFVKQGKTEVPVNPLAVFPTLAFKVDYEGSASDVVIRKVVITNENGGTGQFALTGTVQPASKTITYNALAGLQNPTFAAGSSANDYKIDNASKTLADVFVLYKKAVEDYGVKYTTTSSKKEIVNPNISDFFVADSKKEKSMTLEYAEPAKSVNSAMVIPQSAGYTPGDLTFEIYTNKGVVTIAGTAGTMSKEFTLTAAKDYTDVAGTELIDKAYNAIKYSDGFNTAFLTAAKAEEAKKVEVAFKDDAILVPATLKVSDTDELKYYLTNWYEGKANSIVGGGSDKNTVTIIAEPSQGKSVNVDGDVLNFMASSKNPALKFEGTITIPVGTNADALDKITKASGDLAIINEASLTWKDNNKTFTTITNKGTLVVGEDAGDVKEFTAGIANLGTLTVKGSVGTVTNGSSVEPVNAAAEITLARGIVASLTNDAVATVSGNATVTELTNNKTLTVNEGATLETGASSINKGTITVAAGENGSYEHGGNWNVNGDFTNHAEVVNNVNVKANIVNGGKITVKDGTFTNGVSGVVIEKNATITNNGQIACADNGTEKGTFNNKGYMEVNAGTVTLITENEATAEILVNDGSAQINVPTTPGKITYIVNSQAALTDIPNSVNSLRVVASSIDLTGLDNKKDGKIEYLEFRSNQRMTIECLQDKSEFAKVIFNGGDATAKVQFIVNGKLKATEKFEVKANARVTINDEIEFANATAANYTNQGTLLIIGKLNFSGIEAANKADVNLGEIYFSGGSAATNITWK